MIFGGVKQGKQVAALQRGVHIVVATPGRLLDLIDQGYIQPGTEVVVLAGNSPMRGATNLMKVEVFGDA